MLDVIRRAIRERKPIRFLYPRSSAAPGTRYGNPHTLYLSEGDLIMCDLYQTVGVSESNEPIPSWRRFRVDEMENVSLQSQSAPFAVAPGYNPRSYEHVIEQVQPQEQETH